MRKHIFYNTVNFQPVTFRILFFRGIQTLQMRLSRKACFWWTQLLRPFCRAADEWICWSWNAFSLHSCSVTHTSTVIKIIIVLYKMQKPIFLQWEILWLPIMTLYSRWQLIPPPPPFLQINLLHNHINYLAPPTRKEKKIDRSWFQLTAKACKTNTCIICLLEELKVKRFEISKTMIFTGYFQWCTCTF